MSNNRLSYDGDGSFGDINDDLDNIYYSYVNQHADTHHNGNGGNAHANGSNDTLDSESYRVPAPTDRSKRLIREEVLRKYNQDHPADLPVHISSRLSSMNNNEGITQSAPQTPQSGSSFDFHQNPHLAMSNASLNILDTPTIEEELKDILPKRNHVNESSEALKSLALDTPTEELDQLNQLDTQESRGDDDGIDYAPGYGPGGPRTGDKEWQEKGAATRKVSDASHKVIRRNVQDFEFGKQLGEGSYSTVVLATDKITLVKYAVKILDKRHIIKEKKVKYVNIEKHALNRLSNRLGIISLYFTFQDKESLYFVLDYASNGELLSLIKKYGTLSEDCTRYFGAQILDAIRYMHDNGVIHRDIKPENILLDDKLRIQITDFGTARLLEKKNDQDEDYPLDVRAKSFVGTAEYVSPELLENKYCGKPGDIWAFGCILYQMIAGKPPFKATNEYLTFQKITKLQYAFSAGFPMVLRDLIKQVLVLQPSRRANVSTIRNHYFFQGIDLDNYDQIWLNEPPELGPYKMSAKSMMKVPEITKSPSSQSVAVKKKNGTPGTPGTSAGGVTGRRAVSEGKGVNAASVAAFVLNKNDPENEPEESDVPDTPTDPVEPNLSKTVSRSSNSNSGSNSRHPSTTTQADYIPGTNILRPTINSIHSYRSTSSVKKKPAKPKSKNKPLEVAPMTPLEAAWGLYLNHPDERVLKIGAVLALKINTDYLEKKYKGLLHDSPLGFQNRNRANSTFLTHVVNGNGSGLRGGQNIPEGLDMEDGDESNAIHDFYLVEELPPPSSAESSDPSIGSKLSKFFKKIGLSNNKDKNASNEPITRHPLEKQRTCTMLITSHGRVLIFFRNDPDMDYRLISEIRLNHSFIHFKEVVSNTANKLLKIIPTTGIFVIQSTDTSFTFEVEKYEVGNWTETLAKAQTNQFERDKVEQENKTRKVSPPKVASPKLNSPKLLSPKLMESPEFARDERHERSGKEDKRGRAKPEKSGPHRTNLRHQKREATTSPHKSKSPPPATNSQNSQPNSHHRESLFNTKLKSRSSVKRKPPPPLSSSTGLDMSTGLSNIPNGGMLHAAQLAVSNNSHNPVTNNRRSSFTKEDRPPPPPPQRKVVRSPPPSDGSNAITSKNSKFLARSHRSK